MGQTLARVHRRGSS